jgi:hypothetical protein
VQKTSPKPEINLKQKNLPEFRYVFIGVFNVRKTHNSNSLVIWNLVTKKVYVSVAYIFPNDNFLSLRQNLVTPFLSSTKQKLKKVENKVWYQNIFFLNYRDQIPNCLKNNKGQIWFFQANYIHATNVTWFYHFSLLSFNSILIPKKSCNWLLIWAKISLIMQNNK